VHVVEEQTGPQRVSGRLQTEGVRWTVYRLQRPKALQQWMRGILRALQSECVHHPRPRLRLAQCPRLLLAHAREALGPLPQQPQARVFVSSV
jgi:hypothetical protein